MSPRVVVNIILLRLLFGCFQVELRAEDITTSDGHVFKNASVIKLETDGVVIKHDGGTKRLAWTELPTPLQRRYQAEARRQKEAEVQKLKQDLARAEAEAAKLTQSEAKPKNEDGPPAVAPVESPVLTPAAVRTPAPVKPATVDRPSLKIDEVVDTADLIEEFKVDSAAANVRCKKQTFRIKGVVERFETKLFLRKYDVVLKSPEKFLRVVLRFDYPDEYKTIYTIQKGQKLVGHPAANKEVAMMTVGDSVLFQGTCKGLQDEEIIFTGCKRVR